MKAILTIFVLLATGLTISSTAVAGGIWAYDNNNQAIGLVVTPPTGADGPSSFFNVKSNKFIPRVILIDKWSGEIYFTEDNCDGLAFVKSSEVFFALYEVIGGYTGVDFKFFTINSLADPLTVYIRSIAQEIEGSYTCSGYNSSKSDLYQLSSVDVGLSLPICLPVKIVYKKSNVVVLP